MPYKSRAQAAKFHILLKQGKISPEVVNEFDQASKGMKLPARAAKKKDTGLGNFLKGKGGR